MANSINTRKLYRDRAYYVKKLRELDHQLGYRVDDEELQPPDDNWLLTLLERAVGAFVDVVLNRLDRDRKH